MKQLLTIGLILLSFTVKSQLNNVIKVRIDGNNYYDETVFRFLSDATNGFDSNYDAYKFFSPNNQVPSLFTRELNNEELAINAMPLANLSDTTIDIFALIPVTGQYTIEITELGAIDPGVYMYISIQNGNEFELSGDTTISYQFTQQTDTINALPSLQFRFTETPATNISDNVSASYNNTACNNTNDGSISIQVDNLPADVLVKKNGNTIYQWTSFTGTDSVGGLAQGDYTIEFDQNGQLYTDTVSITYNHFIDAEFEIDSDTVDLAEGSLVVFNNNSSGANGYYWTFGDGNSSVLTHPEHDYSIEGTYTIALVANGSVCSDTSYGTITVIESVSNGIEDIQNEDISILYIQGQGIIVQSNKDLSDFRMNIYDISGRLIKSERDVNNAVRGLNITDQVIVEVTNGKQRFSKLIIAY